MRRFRKAVLMLAIVGFVIASEYAIYHHGLTGYFELGLSSPGMFVYSIQIWVLLILFINWLLKDAKVRGLSPLPYVLAVLATGLLGVLIYLLRREFVANDSRQLRESMLSP